MPRFFFHEIDGVLRQDAEGVELLDHATARAEAVKLLGAMLAERPELLAGDRRFQLQVTEADGVALFIIAAFAIELMPTGQVHPGEHTGKAVCGEREAILLEGVQGNGGR